MAAERVTFDTNILFYALDQNAGEKHTRATGLLRSAREGDAVMLLQSLGELYNAVRKRRLVSERHAERFISVNSFLFPVASATEAELLDAITMQQESKIQFWDALLIATALSARCTVFFSEDMQHNQVLGRLRVVNPFKISAEEVEALLT